ncbi:hypothetical protein AB0425_14445 [Actinosynnema sp. NPDC051121]|nr:hypothetical protein [Saccharothrix sp.]
MNADPPGVDELDPVELELRFAGDEDPVVEPGLDEDLNGLPPVTPEGHHQTHGVPVDAGS